MAKRKQPGIVQGYTELIEHLKRQYKFLAECCQKYDNGDTDFAIFAATIIRTLVHDTANSVSLLRQLNKKTIKFTSIASKYDKHNLVTQQCLLMFDMDGSKTAYVPKLSNSPAIPQNVTFHYWWESQIIMTDTNKTTYNRKQLVLWVANQYGGAHIDPQIDTQFNDLLLQNTTGWVRGTPTNPRAPLDNGVVLPSIRHIAHELIISLSTEFKTLI